MKHLIKGLLSVCIIPLVFVGCATTTKQSGKVTPDKRIYIPEERVQYNHKPQPKPVPYVYTHWVSALNNLSLVREYENFLAQQGVGNIIPSFELMRTARDWAKCGRSQYMIPSRELWSNQVPTLRVFKYLVAANVLTDFEVTSESVLVSLRLYEICEVASCVSGSQLAVGKIVRPGDRTSFGSR